MGSLNKTNLKTSVKKLIHYLNVHKTGFLFIPLAVIMSSCLEGAPTRNSEILLLKVMPVKLIVEDTETLTAKTFNANNKSLHYKWTSEDENITASCEGAGVKWAAPFMTSLNICKSHLFPDRAQFKFISTMPIKYLQCDMPPG